MYVDNEIQNCTLTINRKCKIYLSSYTQHDDVLLKAKTWTRNWVLYHKNRSYFRPIDFWFIVVYACPTLSL